MQLLLAASLASISLAIGATDVTPKQETGTAQLQWSEHYADAKRLAESEQRPLLVIVEDSSRPTGQFAAEQLASDPTQLDLLQQYRLCKMDVNTPYGKRVAEAFGANQFPLTVITDKSARFVMFRADGEMTREAWAQTLANRLDHVTTVQANKVVFDQPVETSVIQSQPAQVSAPVQGLNASQLIVPWPATQQAPSNCPNCIRNQQPVYYYYQ